MNEKLKPKTIKMIHKVECVMVECDNCKDPLDYNGYGIFSDDISAKDSIDEAEWHTDGDKHYCDKCHHFNDEDELVIDISRKKEDLEGKPVKQ